MMIGLFGTILDILKFQIEFLKFSKTVRKLKYEWTGFYYNFGGGPLALATSSLPCEKSTCSSFFHTGVLVGRFI
jgi:hypothetical protein